MKKVIFDCDNTMGLNGKDVDDGLTLLYLLGREDIDVIGVTLTYGNGSLEDVISATNNLKKNLNLDVPVYHSQKAVDFLVESSKKYKDELYVLATGSMTNLYNANQSYGKFYKFLKGLYIMGGIVEDFFVNGVALDELNFSSNPLAAYDVFRNGERITLLNAHTTATALFRKKEIHKIKNDGGRVFSYIDKNIEFWVDKMYKKFGIDGFCNWDIAAAIAITHPGLFINQEVTINPSLEKMKKGDINLVSRNIEAIDKLKGERTISMPSAIKDIDVFNETIFEAWHNLQSKL